MSGMAKKSGALSAVQLPPYWIGMSSAAAESSSRRMARICASIYCASSGEAASPVPIAQTGS